MRDVPRSDQARRFARPRQERDLARASARACHLYCPDGRSWVLGRGDTMSTVTKLPVARKAPRLPSGPVQLHDGENAVAGRVERRLAAILAADVAGYSRLVGADEQGTLVQWRAHWDALIEPAIREHQGRV